MSMPKFVEVRTSEFLALNNELQAARKVVKIASELCAAIDLAEEDIGGARPIKAILKDLGPALNAYDDVKPKAVHEERTAK